MKERAVKQLLLMILILAATAAGPSILAMPSRCGETGECVCITWISGSTGTVEVRCPDGGDPSGWTINGNPRDADGSNGSYGGNGTPRPAPSPLPGMILNPETNAKASSAKGDAIQKLKGERILDEGSGKPIFLPTDCTNLFLNNPLGKTGAWILGSFVILRDGTGVKDTQGKDRCGTNTVGAWTTCCNHDPVVYICPGKFNNMSQSDRIKTLIHEALHVGGQLEDLNGTVGPNDPPNSGQINADVDAACN